MSEPFNPLNEERVRAGRAEICRTDQDLRSGAIRFLEGLRQLAYLRFEASEFGIDEDFIPFVAVDSETDHLPPASVSAYCTQEWRVKSKTQVREVIQVHGSMIFAECEKLIRRFSI